MAILTFLGDLYNKEEENPIDKIHPESNQSLRAIKRPYISSSFGWGLDGGSKRTYRALNFSQLF